MFKWFPTIAQIIICVLLLPGTCFVVSFFLPVSGTTFLLNTVQELPIIGIFLSMMGEMIGSTGYSAGTTLASFLNIMVKVVGSSMYEATVIGMCLYLVEKGFGLIGFGGKSILSVVAGVLLGCVLLGYMGLSGTALVTTMCFLVVLSAVVAILGATSGFFGVVITVMFGFGLQALIAGAASAYVSVLAYILSGANQNIGVLIQLVLYTTVLLGGLLVLDAFITD